MSLTQAYVSLQRLIDRRAAVIVVDGTRVDARRPAPAIADISLEFARFDPLRIADDRRIVRAASRLDLPGPEEAVFSFKEGRYHESGAGEQVRSAHREAIIAELLKEHRSGLRLEQLAELWPGHDGPKPSRGTLHATLTEMNSNGACVRSGMGMRGNPYIYRGPSPESTAAHRTPAETAGAGIRLPQLPPNRVPAGDIDEILSVREKLRKHHEQAAQVMSMLMRNDREKLARK
jgi:hypothetical protein